MDALEKIEKILVELEGVGTEGESDLAKELDEEVHNFVEDCRKKKNEMEYLGVKIDINKILADHLLEKYGAMKEACKDVYTLFKKIMPTLVLCQLVVNGIDEYNIRVLRNFSPLGNSAKYVTLEVLLNSFYGENTKIVENYGVKKHQSK